MKKKKKKYKHTAAFLAKQAQRKKPVLASFVRKYGTKPLPVPAYKVGQRVWHVDHQLPTDAGYIVRERWVDVNHMYGLTDYRGDNTYTCKESELTGFAPLGLEQPGNAKEAYRAGAAIVNRDILIDALKVEVKAKDSRIYTLLDELSDLKKTQGNPGALIPQLQKKLDDAMAAVDDTRKAIGRMTRRAQRLQAIVDAYVDGRLNTCNSKPEPMKGGTSVRWHQCAYEDRRL